MIFLLIISQLSSISSIKTIKSSSTLFSKSGNKATSKSSTLTYGCYIQEYYRGPALTASTCASGTTNIGSYCASNCATGYEAESEERCYKTGTCPYQWGKYQGTSDFLCVVNRDDYGRGAGYVSTKKCDDNDHGLGCQKNGLLYYPKCQAAYSAKGCCICSPNVNSSDCPSGMISDGNYSSGQNPCSFGYVMRTTSAFVCSSSQNTIGTGCYPTCNTNYTAVLGYCFRSSCPTAFPYNCGGNLCVTNSTYCTTALQTTVETAAAAAVLNLTTGEYVNLNAQNSEFRLCTDSDY